MKYIVRHKLRKEMRLTFLIEATNEEEILQDYNLKVTVITKPQDLFFRKSYLSKPAPGVYPYAWVDDYLREGWGMKRRDGILVALRLVYDQKSAEKWINSLIRQWKNYHDIIAKNQKLQREWLQKEN